MLISEAGIDLIAEFEGCRLTAYFDIAGVPTIGYGHTSTVTKADVLNKKTITRDRAKWLLQCDLMEAQKAVTLLVDVPLSQNQFDALVSWTFNLGAGNLKNSTLLKVLNKGRYDLVPNEIKKWNRAGGKVVKGLVRRRQAEADLFASTPIEQPTKEGWLNKFITRLFKK